MTEKTEDVVGDLLLDIEDEEEYRKVVRTWPTRRPMQAPQPRRGTVRTTGRLG